MLTLLLLLLTVLTVFTITSTNPLIATLTRTFLECTLGTLLARKHTTFCTFMRVICEVEVAVAIKSTLFVEIPIDVSFIARVIVIRITANIVSMFLLFANFFDIDTALPIRIPRITIIQIMLLRPVFRNGAEELNTRRCLSPFLECLFFLVGFEEGATSFGEDVVCLAFPLEVKSSHGENE